MCLTMWFSRFTTQLMQSQTSSGGDPLVLTQPNVLLGLWHTLFTILSSEPALKPTDNGIKGL